MPWVRIDDHFDEHPKFAQAGPLGMAMWVTGLAYCNRNLTDGFIPWAVAHRLLTWEYLGPAEERGRAVYAIGVSSGMSGEDVDCALVIGLLISARLWEEVDGGYRVHDYTDYQPTKDEVEAEKAKKQAAGQAGGRASAKARAESNGVAHAEAPAQAKSNPVPKPNPVPGPRKPLVPQEELQRTRKTEVDQTFKDDLEEQFWQAFGSREALRDCIDTAMSHKARLKCTDQQAYLRNWVRADAERRGHPRQNGRPRPLAIVEHPREPDELEQPPPARGKQPCADCGDVTLLALTGPYCYPCTSRRRKKTPA